MSDEPTVNDVADDTAPETEPKAKGKAKAKAEPKAEPKVEAVVGVCIEKCQYQGAIVKPGQRRTFSGGIPERLAKLFRPGT